jgi:hypothetical protein
MIFSTFSKIAANTAIIGPHKDKEVELILAGVKPIAFIAIDQEELKSSDKLTLASAADVQQLDAYVRAHRLLKREIVPSESSVMSNHVGHFYCQPEHGAEMNLLAENYLAWWNGTPVSELPALPRQEGLMFGYTEWDVDLFMGGGWRKGNFLVRSFMNATNGIRRRCRQQVLLAAKHSEIENSEPD